MAAVTHPNADLVASFYKAFQIRDAVAMTACYAPTVQFRDVVFALEGWRARAMWRMLCERGKDLRLEFGAVEADDVSGSAHWEAWYTFSTTGRPVHNVVTASFRFADGRICVHEDRFAFYRWASQALGPTGRLFGWAPPFQAAVRRRSAAALEAYIEKRGITEATA